MYNKQKEEVYERKSNGVTEGISSQERTANINCIPASQIEIINAQRQLHILFHTDYVEFIKTFGGAYAGIAVHAFSNGSSIGNETVDLTLDFRQQFFDYLPPNFLATRYIISMDGEGNPIFIESSGKVYICYHDSGEVKRLANSLVAD